MLENCLPEQDFYEWKMRKKRSLTFVCHEVIDNIFCAGIIICNIHKSCNAVKYIGLKTLLDN